MDKKNMIGSYSRGYIYRIDQRKISCAILLSVNLRKLLLPPENCSLYPGRRRQLPRLNLLRGIENQGVSLAIFQREKPGTYIAFNLGHLTTTESASVTHIDGPGNAVGAGFVPALLGAALSRQGSSSKQSASLGRAEARSALVAWVHEALSIGNTRTLGSATKERLVC